MIINNSQVLYIMMNQQRIWPIIPDTPEILSCFGLGYWSDKDPWTDDLPWED